MKGCLSALYNRRTWLAWQTQTKGMPIMLCLENSRALPFLNWGAYGAQTSLTYTFVALHMISAQCMFHICLIFYIIHERFLFFLNSAAVLSKEPT